MIKEAKGCDVKKPVWVYLLNEGVDVNKLEPESSDLILGRIFLIGDDKQDHRSQLVALMRQAPCSDRGSKHVLTTW